MEISPLLARMLEVRGITDQTEIEKFLKPSLERDWGNPYDIKGMEQVADAVENAVRAGHRILIYGDYDLDGISATVVMMRGLSAIDKHINAGMTVDYFLPKRFSEGYSLSEDSVNRLLEMDPLPQTIITVDCGITSAPYIETLKSHGIDVVVTDHHEKSGDIPVGIAMADPEAEDGDSPDKILAGVGVALKLIQSLGGRLGLPHLWMDFIDLATLGTIADVMPLIGQNRALVTQGLEMINKQPRPSLRAILDVAGRKAGSMTAKDVSYVLTPRLNAAGRMDEPEKAVDLLLCDDYAQAYNIAIEIEAFNNQRREITEKMLEQAEFRAQKIIEDNPGKRSLVLSDEAWHPGVLGIVSAKLAESYNVPTLVMSVQDGVAHGSGRSVGNVDLHEACSKSFDKFIKFGGHKGACGATLKAEDVAEFSEKLEGYMQSLDISEFQKVLKSDLELRLHELNVEDIESLNVMEPFGNANEEPKFITSNVFIRRAKAVGQNHNHLSCNITDGAYGGMGIMFNVSNIDKYLALDSTVSVIYTPKVEEFQGRKNVKMHIDHIIPTDELHNTEDTNAGGSFVSQLFDKFEVKEKNLVSVGDFIKDSVRELSSDMMQRSAQNQSAENLNEAQDFRDKKIDEVQQLIVEAMIGKDGKLHQSQQETLDLLAKGKSVLSVMPTGRGKSLIFQVFAAAQAVCNKKMSIFVYPLRALISDQAFHLQKNLKDFGLNIRVMNGETPADEREENYKLMSEGKLDIMLTTPEFLAIHIDKIAQHAKIGFIVIDESHHMGQVKIGERTAYGHMPKIIEKLNHPQVLALSATVNDDICNEIKKFLPIEEVVKDNFERENLFVDDRRNIKSRDDYLVALCASGEKIVIYVNSRQQTVDLARLIKSRAPHIAMKVGFYNAGMSREDRNKIETLFRENELSVLVATSAFGEGVNIPDIRHVCLYHLPFSNVEFNQMAGRCGRDNNPAIVHLLYNRADATINTQILEMTNPTEENLRGIYAAIRENVKNNNGT